MGNIRVSDEDNALMIDLKETYNLEWNAIVPYFEGRTAGACRNHYTTSLREEDERVNNALWSDEESLLLKNLKEVDNLGWVDIAKAMKNRTEGGMILARRKALKRMQLEGITPRHQVINNEISEAYINGI